MRKVYATGFESTHPDDAPALYISGGSGNTDKTEVHFTFVDPDVVDEDGHAVNLIGWFRVDELLAAISHEIPASKPPIWEGYRPEEIAGISQLIEESDEVG